MQQLDQINQRIQATHAAIARLSSGEQWTMSILLRPNEDHDLVISATAEDCETLVAALEDILGLCTDIDDNELEHVDRCEGETTCPACWARSIRTTIADALNPSLEQQLDKAAAALRTSAQDVKIYFGLTTDDDDAIQLIARQHPDTVDGGPAATRAGRLWATHQAGDHIALTDLI